MTNNTKEPDGKLYARDTKPKTASIQVLRNLGEYSLRLKSFKYIIDNSMSRSAAVLKAQQYIKDIEDRNAKVKK